MGSERELYGKYELVHKIGEGAMAEVFRAVATSIGGFRKPVALKRILPHLSTDAEFVSLFTAGAKLSVALTHGNVVQVFDFGRIDNTYFLAMELVEGCDLTRVLLRQSERDRPMPPEVALYIMAGVLKGLAHAHGRRDEKGRPLHLVHRDVSPHNILLSFEGEVKLTDFGVATATSRVSLTRPHMKLGKFSYMSPEQARIEAVDARSDLWSAGVTLFECLTGRRLFFHEDPSVVLQRVRAPVVPRPSEVAKGLDRDLDELVLRILEKDPRQRPATARGLATELQTELHRRSPGFGEVQLVRYLQELLEDELLETLRPPEPEAGSADTVSDLSRRDRLQERFRNDPRLWTAAELAELLIEDGEIELGVAALRVCALKYAQAGMRAQALYQWGRLRTLGAANAAIEADARALATLNNCASQHLRGRLSATGGRTLDPLIREILDHGYADAGGEDPVLDGLDHRELGEIGALFEPVRATPGQALVREGAPGDHLYIIVQGQVRVVCTNFIGEKLHLSVLHEGEGFGEESFFTGCVRDGDGRGRR